MTQPTDDYADALAEHLAAIAAELAVRVRDEDPATNAIWLRHRLPDPHDWFRLAFVMAAAIPDDRPWTELTAWTDRPPTERSTDTLLRMPPRPPKPAGRGVKPCGTSAAVARHRYHGEELCDLCRQAERDRDKERSARRSAARKAAA